MYLVRTALLLTLLSFSSSYAFSQTENRYVKIVVSDLDTWDEATTIDEFMRAKEGVLVSRTDLNTDQFFAIFTTASGLTENDFKTWLESLGFAPTCMLSADRDGTPVKEFPKDCAGTRGIGTEPVKVH